jgi:hypothetical protein
VRQARVLASPRQLESERDKFIDAVRKYYDMPASFVEKIDKESVAFWPFSYGDLAYAYSLNLRPWSTMEPSYTFTAALDKLMADMLASASAPQWIVRRQRPASDASPSLTHPPLGFLRNPPLDPPLTTREILCRYDEVTRQDSWQLLSRGANRCGTPRVIAQANARWGEPVDVPQPRPCSATLVQIEGTEPRGAELLKALWLRPDPRFILLNRVPYRLVPSLAGEGSLLAVAPDVDYPQPFEMAPNATTVAVGKVGGQPDGTLRYTFLQQPIEAMLTRPGSAARSAC